MSSVIFDGLPFEMRASDRRKTLEIAVDRDGGLLLYVPNRHESSVVSNFVRRKRLWIFTKLAERNALRRPAATKDYVSGEGFLYLGRSYRLLLVNKQKVPVKLEGGRLKMLRSAANDGRSHMARWYSDRGQEWLRRRVLRVAPKMGVTPIGISVRDLGYRWGSCTNRGKLYFHWKCMTLPPQFVDYVITHELAHLTEPRHTSAFWLALERAMPDFKARKRWLAEHAHVVGAV
jgi:predicted metal-dependent hydrolase